MNKNKLWLVQTVDLTKEAREYGNAAPYRFHISGINKATVQEEHFTWTVPCLCGAFDLQYAKYGPGALDLLKQARPCCSIRHTNDKKEA